MEQDRPRQLANSMLGALLAYVEQAAGRDGVRRVCEAAGETRPLEQLHDPSGWSTYLEGLALFHAAAHFLHDPDVGRKAGVELIRRYAGSEVMSLLRSLGSPGEMLKVYPAISAKQSTVTHSEVIEVGEDHGSLCITTPPPITRDALFCGYTIGALSQFPVLFGMEPADVTEPECQTRGSNRCVFVVSWDPTSSVETNLEREVAILSEQVRTLTTRFQSLEGVATDLAYAQDVDETLETITRRAGVAVRAPRYILVAHLPGESAPRIHHVGFEEPEARATAEAVMALPAHEVDPARLVVDIASARVHFGRLAAFYPAGYHFLPQERSLLAAYAGHAAAALETAAALQEARDRNATLSALLALGKALNQVRSRHEVAELVVRAVPDIVGCTDAHVLLWERSDALLVPSGSRSTSGRPSGVPASLQDGGLPHRMMESTEPITAGATSDPTVLGVLRLTGLPQALMVALAARGEFLGVLVVGSHDDEMQGSDAVRERLGGVASLTSTALDGAALLDEVRYQALHDPVTDLANARLFEDRVSHAIAVSRRSGAHHGLLFIDLDRFKVVNDSRGHKMGDEVLRVVAGRLAELVRTEDTVARIGGDEFGILLQAVGSAEDARQVADTLINHVAEPIILPGGVITVGASIGVAVFPDELDDYETVLARADSAMYEAKAAGRGRCRLAPSLMWPSSLGRGS